MKQIKVIDIPLTYIIVAEGVDEEEARRKWLKKYHLGNAPLSQAQIDKEKAVVREGRVLQRKKYK